MQCSLILEYLKFDQNLIIQQVFKQNVKNDLNNVIDFLI
jgi:hypothetical protein